MDNQYMQINRNHLRAMTCIMAKNDLRYYLNGVAVEATQEYTTLIATDGHRMLIIRDDSPGNTIAEPHALIIPDTIVKTLISGNAMGKVNVPIMLEKLDEERWQAPLLKIGSQAKVSFNQIPGNFPNWRRVIPKKVSGKPGHYRPDYIMDFEKAARYAAGVSRKKNTLTHIRMNGEKDAALVKSIETDGFLGLLMPMHGTTNIAIPEWATKDAPDNIAAFYGAKK